MHKRIIFKETQYPHPMLYLLIFIVPAMIIYSFKNNAIVFELELLVPLLAFFLVILLLFKMETIVNPDEIIVSFGWIRLFKTRVSLNKIVSSKAITYRPIVQCGGWGMRFGKIEKELTSCLSLSGNKGVLLVLSDGVSVCFCKNKRLLINTQRPDEFIRAINSAISS